MTWDSHWSCTETWLGLALKVFIYLDLFQMIWDLILGPNPNHSALPSLANPQKRLQLCSSLFSLLFPFHVKHHSPADLISGNMLCTDFLTGPLRNSGYCSSHHSNCSPSQPFVGPGMKLSPLSSDRNPLPPAASRHSSPAVSSSHTHAAS